MPNAKNKKLIIFVTVLLALIAINSDRILKLFSSDKIPTTITVYDKTFNLEIADTPEERGQGLSNRQSLAQDTGLLFIFEQPGRYGFWMKDMNFPIDIVWLDKNKKVLGATKNLQPSSYPKIFYSPENTSYALEINLGILP